MSRNSALFAVCFVAGLLAGLGNSLFVWACGEWGLTAFIGVNITPALKLSWLYPQLIFGGLWGLGYFFTIGVPRWRRHWIRKGIWFSLLPSAYSLFYAYPYLQNHGLAGLELGMLTPLFVIAANLLWGILTGFFTRLFWGSLKRMLKQLLVCSLFLLCASPLFAAELTGTVSWIYDGDTLEVAGIGRVRLLGIDTPEGKDSVRDNFYRKQFGIGSKQLRLISRQAKSFNIQTAKGAQVRLVTEAVERDRHDRLLAYLYLPDGRLLNRSLLENGLATVFRRYQFSLKNDFLAAETAAQQAKIGLWQQ